MATKKMVNPITGLIHVCGEHDTGKTTFSLSSGFQPERTAFIDADIKGRNTLAQVLAQSRNFGLYVNLLEAFSRKLELERHQIGLDIIERMIPGAFDVLVWDTWTSFEDTFRPYVHANRKEFRAQWNGTPEMVGAIEWNVSFEYEAQIINNLLERVPLVILTTHLKDENINGKKTGRQVAAGKRTLNEKSSLRLWLRHNPDGPEPIGLVLKRPNKMIVTPNGLQPVNILPRKLKPCTWERIRKFWDEPVGNRALAADEKPDEFELSILDGILTADQRAVLKLAVLESEREEIEASFDAPLTRARELISVQPNIALPDFAKTLGVSVTEARALRAKVVPQNGEH